MEEIRDYFGKLVCTADGGTGMIKHKNGDKLIITCYLPVGGQIAFETPSSYTLIDRRDDDNFYVNLYPN